MSIGCCPTQRLRGYGCTCAFTVSHPGPPQTTSKGSKEGVTNLFKTRRLHHLPSKPVCQFHTGSLVSASHPQTAAEAVKQRRASHGTPTVSGSSDHKPTPGLPGARASASQVKGKRTDTGSSASSQPSGPASRQQQRASRRDSTAPVRDKALSADVKADNAGDAVNVRSEQSAGVAWGTSKSRRGAKGRRSGSAALPPVPEDAKVSAAGVKSEHQPNGAGSARTARETPVEPAAVKREALETATGAGAAAQRAAAGKRKARPSAAIEKKGQPSVGIAPAAVANGATRCCRAASPGKGVRHGVMGSASPLLMGETGAPVWVRVSRHPLVPALLGGIFLDCIVASSFDLPAHQRTAIRFVD